MLITYFGRSIIGPVIGGALARPCVNYPSIFSPGTIWEQYPYLLPNLFSAATVCCGVVIGILFLEETHAEKKKRRDQGIELGNRIIAVVTSSSWHIARGKKVEKQGLLEYEELPGYQTTENSPQIASTSGPELQEPLDLSHSAAGGVSAPEPAAPKAFTKPVVLNIISYGILAL
jgi:hypothetical protein